MMGQQQIMESAAALRRIMLVVLVAALMTVIGASAAWAETKPFCYHEPSTDEQGCAHVATPSSGGHNLFVHSKDDETGPANPDEKSVTHTDTTGHTVKTPSGNMNHHGDNHVNGNK